MEAVDMTHAYFDRRIGEGVDDEENDLLDCVADAIQGKLSDLGVTGTWSVDQDEDNRLDDVHYWADFGEIIYPIVSDQGQRLKVVLKVERIEDANEHVMKSAEEPQP